MNASARSFCQKLERDNLKFQVIDENENKTVIRCGIRGKNATIETYLFFDTDDRYLTLRTMNYIHVPDDSLGGALIACNQLNCDYKWVKFYIDEDGDVLVQDDAILGDADDAEESFELMLRMVQIADESYPVIMKAIYS